MELEAAIGQQGGLAPHTPACSVTWSWSHLLGPRFPQSYSEGEGLDTPPWPGLAPVRVTPSVTG